MKVDVAYSHQNVKVLGVSGGVSYGALGGASHHTLHDIATLRCIPELTIILPSDAAQTEEVVRTIAHERGGAFFIRIGREKIPPQIYTEELGVKPFTLGKANTLREGGTPLPW